MPMTDRTGEQFANTITQLKTQVPVEASNWREVVLRLKAVIGEAVADLEADVEAARAGKVTKTDLEYIGGQRQYVRDLEKAVSDLRVVEKRLRKHLGKHPEL